MPLVVNRPPLETPTARRVNVGLAPGTYQGTLTVQSLPAGAAVYLNQRYVGETPLAVPRLRAGSHVVWVQGEGYRKWTAGVHVPADRNTTIRANLERQSGR